MDVQPWHAVAAVMDRAPATIRVFLDHRMQCVGCPIARFHSVEEACREHGLALAPVLAALDAAAP
ncbi:DUF1858 domain-containing protein [Blastochloris sulfoviridis]|uniref:DUF1858 domain-containing protein n=1 Tax=Blastochloris sulfoviridis TaxID=50712 RepID=A0A5M6HJD8_9HYPH|nr:DUF1858 domain-containing protein [Blastochloris sulfoviridis]KAA5595982.1 DUF1858 domain-containing protein [Blastochloris sulfoviridis]